MRRKDFQQKIIPLADKAYRLAYRLLEDKQEAEDVVQDAFLKLWNMRKTLSEVEHLEAFTINMVKRICIDRIRHEQIKRKHADPLKAWISMEGHQDKPDEKEVYMEIHKTIKALPDEQKRIVMLRDVEGFTYEEVSEITGLTINNLRVSLSRIRKTIKEAVKKKFEYGLKRDQ